MLLITKSWQNKLKIGGKKINGRNNSGKITVNHRGGGNKKKYRILDFQKYIWNAYGLIINFEYDPGRNTIINNICSKELFAIHCIYNQFILEILYVT